MKLSQITESSLSRIQAKIAAHATGAITAYRGDKSYEENQSNNKDILAYLLKKGYSVTKVRGSYIENHGSTDANEVAENSFFVSSPVAGDDGGALERDLISLGLSYDQDSILTIPFDGDATLVGTSSRDNAWPGLGVRQSVGRPTFGDPQGEFFSRIGGRKFAFEEEITAPDTINGKWALSISARTVEDRLKPPSVIAGWPRFKRNSE